MNGGLLISLDETVEVELLKIFESMNPRVQVMRRCVDLAELIGSARAGLGAVALTHPQILGLDRIAIKTMQKCGLHVVLLAQAQDMETAFALEPDEVLAAGNLQEAAHLVADIGTRIKNDTEMSKEPQLQVKNYAEQIPADVGMPPPPTFADQQRAQTIAGAIPAAEGGKIPEKQPKFQIQHSAVRGKIIAVVGSGGGPGRSVLAREIAAKLALSEETILVDADTLAPSQVQLMGMLQEASGLAGAVGMAIRGILNVESLDKLLRQNGKLKVLTGLDRSARWREINAIGLDKLWHVCRESAAYTVVDTAPRTDSEAGGFTRSRDDALESVCSQADVLIMVGRGDPIGVQRLVLELQDLAERKPAGNILVVVNRLRKAATGANPRRGVKDIMVRFAPDLPLYIIEENAEIFGKSMLEGVPICELKNSDDFTEVLGDILHAVTGEKKKKQVRAAKSWTRRRKSKRIA